jgi:hypothetical protein
MGTETLTITATRSVSIVGCEGSPTPSSQTSTTTRQGGKRKNHRGGKKNKKKSGTKTKPLAGSNTEDDDPLAENVKISQNEPAKEQKPQIVKKKHVEEANDQPELALEPIEIASTKDEVSAAIERLSKVFSRLAVLEALEAESGFERPCQACSRLAILEALEAKFGFDEAVNNAGCDSLVTHCENNTTETTGQEVQGAANKATITTEDKSVPHQLEQEHAQDHLSNSPDQYKFDTGKEEVASRVREINTIAAGQEVDAKETIISTTAKEEDRDGTATIEQSNHSVNDDNEELRKRDDTASEIVNHKEENAANDDAAAPQEILNISEQDYACVTTNKTIVIDAPQDTATTTTQWFTKVEAENTATAAVEEAEDSDSTVTPDNYAASEQVSLPTAGREFHGVAEIVGLAPKEVEAKDDGNVAVATTVTSAEAAVSPKLDLRASPIRLLKFKY